MRLTEKSYIGIDSPETDRYIKLSQIEDIEDDFGIDLIILFKALKNGIYYITPNKNVIGYLDVKWSWCIGRTYFKTKYGNFYFKDYGKTWALTKEELE